MAVLIDGILVDLEALRRIRHTCDAAHCDRAHHCCSQYEISLGRREMTRMIGLMGRAAAFAGHLREGGELINPFDEDEPGQFVIDSDDNQRCVFAYGVAEVGGEGGGEGEREGEGEGEGSGPRGCKGGRVPMTYCSLHSAALEAGLEPYEYKPRSCALWPLAMSEDTPPVLTIQDADGEFACNQLGEPRLDGRLDEGIEDLLARNFGKAFLAKVLGALGEGCGA